MHRMRIDPRATEVHATFRVPVSRFDALEKAVLKLARKVNKDKTFTTFPPALSKVETIVIVKDDGITAPFDTNAVYTDEAKYAEYVQFYLDYQRPILNGWMLVCTYDWEWNGSETTCYVNTVPGMNVLEEYMNVEDGRCDHCKTNRRRKKSMLVTKDFIEFKVVGSTCIKDFLGHKNPQSFIDCYAFEQTLDTYTREFPSSTEGMAVDTVHTVLAVTNLLVRLNGYTKAGEWGAESTKDQVNNYINASTPEINIYRRANPLTTKDSETATKVMEWIVDQPNNSEYMDTMQKAVKAGAITYKRYGVVCSGVLAYNRAMEKKAATVALKSNEFIGEIKQRIPFGECTVKSVRYFDGYHDTVTQIVLETEKGDCLMWRASGSLEIEIGEVWNIQKATIKKHNLFNGRNQTVVNRVVYTETHDDTAVIAA